jgi:hypothetical protein
MIREDLVAERIAIESYSEIVLWLGDDDRTTRKSIEDRRICSPGLPLIEFPTADVSPSSGLSLSPPNRGIFLTARAFKSL